VLQNHGLAGRWACHFVVNPRASGQLQNPIPHLQICLLSKRRTQPESPKAAHVAKRQVQSFAIPPKAHAVMEYIPQVVDGRGLDAGGFVLTVPGGPRPQMDLSNVPSCAGRTLVWH
jgi:hypothetical protein